MYLYVALDNSAHPTDQFSKLDFCCTVMLGNEAGAKQHQMTSGCIPFSERFFLDDIVDSNADRSIKPDSPYLSALPEFSKCFPGKLSSLCLPVEGYILLSFLYDTRVGSPLSRPKRLDGPTFY